MPKPAANIRQGHFGVRAVRLDNQGAFPARRAHWRATSPDGCRIHPETAAATPAESFVSRLTRRALAGRLPNSSPFIELFSVSPYTNIENRIDRLFKHYCVFR